KWFQLNTQNQDLEKSFLKDQKIKSDVHIGVDRNKKEIKETVNERDANIDDFYAKRDIYKVDALDRKEYEEFKSKLDDKDLELLNANKQFYEIQFSNVGGLVMPLILEFTFINGKKEVIRIPAEIWRQYEDKVSKVFIFDQEVTSVRLDPFLETADTDLDNNSWPKKEIPSRYQLFKQQQSKENPMQREKRMISGE
ncbi:MAG TPA: aminopeptidase, partial [Crocinitomicaceae bacterium]|nr:aminopeptidase [Crocinitomicaceae bacterium]